MRKLILSFSLGSVIGMGAMLMIRPLCACQNEMTDLIKTKCQKMKDQMQSSKKECECSMKEKIDDVIDSIDSIDEDSLPSKVKKTLNNIRLSLENLIK